MKARTLKLVAIALLLLSAAVFAGEAWHVKGNTTIYYPSQEACEFANPYKVCVNTP